MAMKLMEVMKLIKAIKIAKFFSLIMLLWFFGCTEVNIPSGNRIELSTGSGAVGTAEGIHVQGVGVVREEPNLAKASVGVQTFDADASKATDRNSEKVEAVLAALRSKGIEDDRLETSSFSIVPQRDYDKKPPEVVGFKVSNMISLSIVELDRIGEFLQVAIGAGANNISGLQFLIEEIAPLKEKARILAIEDARHRAEVMAEAAGVEVGRPIRISEKSWSSPVYRKSYAVAFESADAVPIETPNELETSVTVEVIFEIN